MSRHSVAVAWGLREAGVCTFEILLGDIAGLDYWNPLLVDASRVVIEVGQQWYDGLQPRSSV